MDNYDLLALSWIEFENLTKDLLQREFNLYIETFTPGKDDGIDLRFALAGDKKSIVQCKRMSNFNSLYNKLKKEKNKLLDKKIDRYYISTTVGLTPKGKTKIFELFYPFIKDEADIFGKNDIINLISKYPDIEEKYNKLWLTSTEALKRLLNAKVYNSSKIQMEQIKEDVRIYVQNESFNLAQKILEENHYIIISGIPGIGKTTLARMLVYNLIASGINDLVHINSNVGEAYKSYHESNKQVFLFDDFLGKNFLEDRLDRNEDQQMLSFLNKIRNTKNKYFIMTTREYILKQAQQKYELLNRHNIDIVKCIIDLAMYTPLVRAEILYKHLYFSDISLKYLEELIKEQRYLKIIDHKNYNPRIIEAILDKKEWEIIPPASYYGLFSSYFDNPESVWRHAFEQQISPLGRIIVIILGSINWLVKLDHLKNAVKKYLKDNIISYVVDFNIDFEGALKELAGSFIKIEKDDNNTYAVEYFNPSVADFIHKYFISHIDIMKSIIKNCVCLDQLMTMYQIFEGLIPEEIKILCENKINNYFDELDVIRLYRSSKVCYRSEDESIETKLYYISRYFFPLINNCLLNSLRDKFYADFDNISCFSSYEKIVAIYLSFYEHSEIEKFEQFLEILMDRSDSLDKLLEIARLKEVDKDTFYKIIKTDISTKKVMAIAAHEAHETNEYSWENTRDSMLEVSSDFNVDLDCYIDELSNKVEEEKRTEEHIEVHKDFKRDDIIINQNRKIKDLFDTLLLK